MVLPEGRIGVEETERNWMEGSEDGGVLEDVLVDGLPKDAGEDVDGNGVKRHGVQLGVKMTKNNEVVGDDRPPVGVQAQRYEDDEMGRDFPNAVEASSGKDAQQLRNSYDALADGCRGQAQAAVVPCKAAGNCNLDEVVLGHGEPLVVEGATEQEANYDTDQAADAPVVDACSEDNV